jgi:hypothetical protein
MHFRYGYAIERPEWYARALLDAGYTWIHRDAFTEAGSDATNLDIHAANMGIGSLQPALELGREFVFTGGTHMRVYARGGYTRVLSGDKTSLVASFVGAPSAVTPFSVSQSWDTSYTDLTGGLDLISDKGYVFRFSYTDSTSDRAKTRAGTVKLSVPF